MRKLRVALIATALSAVVFTLSFATEKTGREAPPDQGEPNDMAFLLPPINDPSELYQTENGREFHFQDEPIFVRFLIGRHRDGMVDLALLSRTPKYFPNQMNYQITVGDVIPVLGCNRLIHIQSISNSPRAGLIVNVEDVTEEFLTSRQSWTHFPGQQIANGDSLILAQKTVHPG